MKHSNVRHYDAQYQQFSQELYASIRREAMGEDIGQNGWLTRDEHDQFIAWMAVDSTSRVLDIACGSGQPTMRIAERTGCAAVGIDLHEDGVAAARRVAEQRGVSKKVQFQVADASASLPFEDASFDAIICVDAINHLPGRERVLREWRRLLKPQGRLVFTDPITITGPINDEEMRIRSSIGYFLFVPPGADEKMLCDAGFDIKRVEDHTENMAVVARRWHIARAKNEKQLREIEGDDTFEGQQQFFDVTATLAEQRRLSRFAYLAVRAD